MFRCRSAGRAGVACEAYKHLKAFSHLNSCFHNVPPTKETVVTAKEICIWTRLKTHIEPFNILIISAGENL